MVLMTTISPNLVRLTSQALIAATGEAAPTMSQLASAFDLLCERLRTRLHPLFGTVAVAALFARAHSLRAIEFAWLAEVLPKDGDRCSLDALDPVRLHLSADDIAAGLATALAQVVGLLTTFIGDELVIPLLQDAWGPGYTDERAQSRIVHSRSRRRPLIG